MRLPNMFSVLTSSALLIGATSANALELTIDDLSTAVVDISIDDTTVGVGNTTANDGIIDFTGSAGTFGVEVAIAEGAPERGSALVIENFLDYQVASAAEGASSLVITLTESDVSLNTTGTNGKALGLSSVAIGEASAPGTSIETFIRIGVDTFEIDSVFDVISPPFVVSNASALLNILPGQLFDLVTRVTINHSNKFDQSNGSSLVTVAPIPLPAALPLFLTALLGLGFVGRHRRRQVA